MSNTARKSRKRYQRALLRLETLEPRTLLSADVSSFTVENVYAQGGAYDSNGNLWVLNFRPNGTQGLDEIRNGSVVAPVDLNNNPEILPYYSPTYVTGGLNGDIYLADSGGAIDVVHTGTGLTERIPLVADGFHFTPDKLTVTADGAVWFVGTAMNDTTFEVEYVVGRYTASQGVIPYQLDTSDSFPLAISPGLENSIWVGMGAAQDGNTITGSNHVLALSYDHTIGNITLTNSFTANNTTNVSDTTQLHTQLRSIVGDADGSVWFSLANSPDFTGTHAPDTLVHASADGNSQTFVTVGDLDTVNDTSSALTISNLLFDVNGNLWFNELTGSQVGYLDLTTSDPTKNFVYTMPLPTADDLTHRYAVFGQYQAIVNRDGTQITLITQSLPLAIDPHTSAPIFGTIDPDTGEAIVGNPILTINITPDLPPEFSGSVSITPDGLEDTSHTLLATFSAPTPEGAYSALITWGDSTSTIVPVTFSDGLGTITASKSYATQGSYDGTIVVSDDNGTVGHIDFTSAIGDIPLNLTSLRATPLFLRITTVVATFTDDGDLPLSTWTATINWGDNTTSSGLIVRDPTQPGRYFVLALHRYRTSGTYNVSMTVTTTESLAAVTNGTLTTSVTTR
jgi:streptogramin lyase